MFRSNPASSSSIRPCEPPAARKIVPGTIFFFTFLLIGLGTALPASAAITLVNTASGFDDSGAKTTTIAATAANHTAGNLLVVIGRGGNRAATMTVSDTAGNTFTQIATGLQGGMQRLSIFYAKNITGNASNVVTVTYSGIEDFRHVHVLQYSGLDKVSPLDTNASGGGASGGTLTSGNFTTANVNEVRVFAGNKFATGTSFTPGTGYVAELTTDGVEMTQDKIVSTIQS